MAEETAALSTISPSTTAPIGMLDDTVGGQRQTAARRLELRSPDMIGADI